MCVQKSTMVWNVNRRKLLRRVELGRERPKIQWAGTKSMTIKWKMGDC